MSPSEDVLMFFFALDLIPGNSTGTPIFIKNEPENVNTKAVGDVKQAVNNFKQHKNQNTPSRNRIR